MPRVPIGFPFRLDNEQLDGAIAEMLERPNWPGFDDFGSLSPELKVELVAAGLQERQQREQAEAARRVLRVAYATLGASIVALIVAVITVATS